MAPVVRIILAGIDLAGDIVDLIRGSRNTKQDVIDAVQGQAAGRAATEAAECAGHEQEPRCTPRR